MDKLNRPRWFKSSFSGSSRGDGENGCVEAAALGTAALRSILSAPASRSGFLSIRLGWFRNCGLSVMVAGMDEMTVLDEFTADLFDLDTRAVPAYDMTGSNTATDCTDNGCTKTCQSCGCTKTCQSCK